MWKGIFDKQVTEYVQAIDEVVNKLRKNVWGIRDFIVYHIGLIVAYMWIFKGIRKLFRFIFRKGVNS